jgi:hypothetical protein
MGRKKAKGVAFSFPIAMLFSCLIHSAYGIRVIPQDVQDIQLASNTNMELSSMTEITQKLETKS